MQMSDETKTTAYNVPPVQRAITLLRAIADGDTISNLSSASKKTGINRTTLIRLLHTLESERMIEKVPNGSGYRIGLGLVALAAHASYSRDVVQIAQPIAFGLAESIGLSAHVGVLDGGDALYLLREVPNVPLASNIRVGSKVPAYATTLGRAILAFMPEEETVRLYSDVDLTQFTERSPNELKELLERLREERELGYAYSEGLYSQGVASVGAPIRDAEGRVVAAINVTGPEMQFHEAAGRRDSIIEAVGKAAREISLRLGFKPTSSTLRRIP